MGSYSLIPGMLPRDDRFRAPLYAAPARRRGVGALAGRRPPTQPGRSPRSCIRKEEKPLDTVAAVDPEGLKNEALAAVAAAHVLRERGRGAAQRDIAVADPHDGGEAAAGLHGLARPVLPPRHARRDALPDLPPGRRPGRRPRDHARRPEGDAAHALART